MASGNNVGVQLMAAYPHRTEVDSVVSRFIFLQRKRLCWFTSGGDLIILNSFSTSVYIYFQVVLVQCIFMLTCTFEFWLITSCLRFNTFGSIRLGKSATICSVLRYKVSNISDGNLKYFMSAQFYYLRLKLCLRSDERIWKLINLTG